MSEIRANTVSNAAGTGPVTLTGQYAAKAWIHFEAVPSTVVRASGNVSSLTDSAVGDFTINFTNSFTDAYYAIGQSVDDTGYADYWAYVVKPFDWSTSNLRIGVCYTTESGGGFFDAEKCSVTVTR